MKRATKLFFLLLSPLVLAACTVGRTDAGGVVFGPELGAPLPEGAAQTAGAIGGMLFGPVGASVGAGVVGLLGLVVQRHGAAAKAKGELEATNREWSAASDHYNPPPKATEKA